MFDSYLEDSFVRESRSLVFIGGLGKTHLSVAVGMRMVHRGYRVKFTTVQDYLNRYLSAESTAQWKRYQAPFRKSDLLILDEFGYLAPDPNVAPLLYELISERYEKKATITTSNKSLKWGRFTATNPWLALSWTGRCTKAMFTPFPVNRTGFAVSLRSQRRRAQWRIWLAGVCRWI